MLLRKYERRTGNAAIARHPNQYRAAWFDTRGTELIPEKDVNWFPVKSFIADYLKYLSIKGLEIAIFGDAQISELISIDLFSTTDKEELVRLSTLFQFITCQILCRIFDDNRAVLNNNRRKDGGGDALGRWSHSPYIQFIPANPFCGPVVCDRGLSTRCFEICGVSLASCCSILR